MIETAEIDRMIKDAVEKAVMQSIDDLGVKSVMREKIIESGISKDEVRQMVRDSVDSYVRSVDIKHIARVQVSRLVKDAIEKEIKELFELRTFDYKANSVLREEMKKQVVNAFNEAFKVTVNVEKRAPEQTADTENVEKRTVE